MNALRFLWLLLFCVASLTGQQDGVDFLKGTIRIEPDPQTASLVGEVQYRFAYSEGSDSLFLDARQMELTAVQLDGKPVRYRYNGARLVWAPPPKSGEYDLTVRYRCTPKAALYFIGWNDSIPDNEQIWTQGQGKYSSNWVPSFDDMREKVVFNLRIRFDSPFIAVANGRLTGVHQEAGYKIWSFAMEQPMSSYLLAFAIGRYEKLDFRSRSGILNELYYPYGQDTKARVTYSHSKEIFDFLEAEIGLPYPWQVYRQVPVDDFLYAGMENTTLTLFSSEFLVDSVGYQDRNYVNVNAHELAHQWFGNLVTEADGASHWLHEGFASFYAYLAEAEVSDWERVYWKLYDTALRLEALDEQGAGTSLLDPQSNSLIFYEKGAWALFALRELLGPEDFRKGIRKYLREHAYGNATVTDFLGHMEKAGGAPLQAFRKTWLESTEFPLEWAREFLSSQSPSLAYFLRLTAASEPVETFERAWDAFSTPNYRAALLEYWPSPLGQTAYGLALDQNDPLVLKTALRGLLRWEDWMQPLLEPLLDGPGYEIREAALYRLWVAVPHARRKYLEYTAANGSMEEPTFRQLWWMLAVFTDDFRTLSERRTYLDSLQASTASGLPRRVRRNGFELLRQIQALTDRNLRDLVQATEHHSWQFRLFARRMLDQLLEERPDAEFWRELAMPFPKESFPYFHRKIAEL